MVCTNIYSCLLDTYSRQFQYRLIHDYLTVKKTLLRWKLSETELCSYCMTAQESVNHLFCECAITKTFYLQIKEWLGIMNVKLPDLESKTILHNIYDKCKNVKLINHCINLYKQIVFINRGELLSLNLFKAKLSETQNIERCIANKNGKVETHINKWEKILEVL